jgi:hypothetical protein
MALPLGRSFESEFKTHIVGRGYLTEKNEVISTTLTIPNRKNNIDNKSYVKA